MNRLQQNVGCNQKGTSDLVECLWMEAGVVDYKLCDRSYDCEHCPFDEAVQSRSAKLIVAADLFAEDVNNPTSAGGCEIAPDLFFHTGHTWARVEDQGVIRTGLDDFGQRMLGRAYSLSLPALKSDVYQGKACTWFAHQSGLVALPAPVCGQIKETNPNLDQRPELVNHDPYHDGWILLIEPADLKGSLKRLMYGARVRQWLLAEIERLRLLISDPTNCDQRPPGTTMPDGGSVAPEFLSGLDVAQSRRIIKSFFPLPSHERTEKASAIISSRR
jgi:glycine cleavage system H lipoate-binding protein